MTEVDVALGVGKVGYIQDGLRNMVPSTLNPNP